MYVKPFSALGSEFVFLCVSLQLQKRKEREEQLEDVIQAYEKIHMEKSNLQRDLDKMVRHITQSTALCTPFTGAIWLINKLLELHILLNITCRTGTLEMWPKVHKVHTVCELLFLSCF